MHRTPQESNRNGCRTGKNCKLKELCQDIGLAMEPVTKIQWQRPRDRVEATAHREEEGERERERSGCRGVVSSLQPRKNHKYCLKFGEKRSTSLLSIQRKELTFTEGQIRKKRKLKVFVRKGEKKNIVNQTANLLAKTSSDSSELKKGCLYNHLQHLGRETARNRW